MLLLARSAPQLGEFRIVKDPRRGSIVLASLILDEKKQKACLSLSVAALSHLRYHRNLSAIDSVKFSKA